MHPIRSTQVSTTPCSRAPSSPSTASEISSARRLPMRSVTDPRSSPVPSWPRLAASSSSECSTDVLRRRGSRKRGREADSAADYATGGQLHKERRAAADAALRPHARTEALHRLAHQGEPDAGARILVLAMQPLEHLEDLIVVLHVEADAVVGDRQQ